MAIADIFSNIYDKQYKKLAFISMFVLFLSITSLAYTYATTGELFQQGVSLKGGITLTIPVTQHYDTQILQEQIAQQLPQSDIGIREITEGANPKALIIETDATQEQIIQAAKTTNLPIIDGTYNIESMAGSLGQSFYAQTMQALFFAFIAMAIVVYITFRSPLPSLFVVLSGLSTILSTLAVINLLEVKLTTAGIASFLMLIGYSVDTNILLTTHVLHRKGEGGTVSQRLSETIKTGLTMIVTSFAAAFLGYLFSQSDIIKQIMLIISIGLLFDVLYTWMQNAGILRWYLEKNENKTNTQ